MTRKWNKVRRLLYKSPAYIELQRRIGHAVLALREEKEWTQETAAEKCEMTTKMYQLCETGGSNLTLITIIRLCTGFKVDAEEFFRKRE